MAKFSNGRVKYIFSTYTVQTRLLMLKCLAFNDETFFLIRLSKSIYKLDIDLSANISVIGFQI